MISLLQDNTKYFKVIATLQEKTLDAINTTSKSINESNNKITENNKTLTESIKNLLLEITTINQTLLNNITRVRNILNDNNDNIIKKVKNGNDCSTKFIDCNSFLAIMKL